MSMEINGNYYDVKNYSASEEIAERHAESDKLRGYIPEHCKNRTRRKCITVTPAT